MAAFIMGGFIEESQSASFLLDYARELQGDHPETADINSEPSVFIRILLALVNTEHPG
jgi:hypothetical protein